MTIKPIGAHVRLFGFPTGPIHTTVATRLHEILIQLPQSSVQQPKLMHCLREVAGFKRLTVRRTSDGYKWKGFEFEVASGGVVLLIPPAVGWSRQEGYCFDRLPCGFGNGVTSASDVTAVMARVGRALLSQ